MDAVFDQFLAKIYHQAQFHARQPQIGERLRLKNGIILDSSFAFHNDTVIHDQINTQRRTKKLSFIHNW